MVLEWVRVRRSIMYVNPSSSSVLSNLRGNLYCPWLRNYSNLVISWASKPDMMLVILYILWPLGFWLIPLPGWYLFKMYNISFGTMLCSPFTWKKRRKEKEAFKSGPKIRSAQRDRNLQGKREEERNMVGHNFSFSLHRLSCLLF